jgi:hypothetical protein
MRNEAFLSGKIVRVGAIPELQAKIMGFQERRAENLR